jgi:hypothetical protein
LLIISVSFCLVSLHAELAKIKITNRVMIEDCIVVVENIVISLRGTTFEENCRITKPSTSIIGRKFIPGGLF